MSAALVELEPTYHDFSWLGLPTRQIEGIYAPNQAVKAPVITAYILLALARLKARGVAPISFAELFCADGFYAMFAARFGGFFSAILGAMQNWNDNALSRMPGVRDRIARVRLQPTEGGLNLNMEGGVIQAVAEPWRSPDGFEVVAGVSVGICMFPEHANTTELLLQGAHAAVYGAKARGRGAWCFFHEAMTQAARERLALETRLRQGRAQGHLPMY